MLSENTNKDELPESEEEFPDDVLIESISKFDKEIPDPDMVPDFSFFEEKSKEIRKKYSKISNLLNKPLMFLSVQVIPKKFDDGCGHECLVHVVTLNDKKHHTFRTCSRVMSRQFADIYTVLYKKRTHKNKSFSIVDPFKGIIEELGKGADGNGKVITFYKITTTIKKEDKDECGNTIPETVEREA